MQKYACGVGKIIITSDNDLVELAKKFPQIFDLLSAGHEKIDPVELVPKIQQILGVDLKEVDEFMIERQIFSMKKGEIVGLGEQIKEYSDWYSLEEREFEYRDSNYHIECKGNDAIRMTVEGSYKELKDISVKDLYKLAEKKKKELIGKIEKIKL